MLEGVVIPMKNSATENLKKGIVLILVANAINLIISLANGFILPKYLSVETYADIKTYQLYANYIGVLALGYSDGLYLSYGGKKITQVESKNINICRTNLILFQGLVTLGGIAVVLLTKNTILLITATSIIPVNIAATYKNIFQATGEFKTYSKILNYTSILTFLGSIFLLVIIKTDNSATYIIWYVVVAFLIWIMMENKMIREYHKPLQFCFDIKNLVINIKSGIVLMLGNFSSILMTSIDRWFVKALLTVQDFAHYSFVVSVENLIAIFITPVVTTMYNYICTTTDMNSIKRIKKMCLIFSVFLIASAFPVKFILEIYLTKYLASQYVLFILFSTEIFYMLIKGIYVNIYKARKQQSKYLKQLIIVLIIGAVFNGTAYCIHHSKEAIAFATLLSVIIWYVVCCISVKEIKPDWKENLLLIVSVPTFIICGFFLPSILGFAIYIGIVFVFSIIFMRDIMMAVIDMAIGIIKRFAVPHS